MTTLQTKPRQVLELDRTGGLTEVANREFYTHLAAGSSIDRWDGGCCRLFYQTWFASEYISEILSKREPTRSIGNLHHRTSDSERKRHLLLESTNPIVGPTKSGHNFCDPDKLRLWSREMSMGR
jgi:hypothetical protein